MYFNSPVFLFVFLPVVLAGYYIVPAVARLRGPAAHTFINAALFIASVFFYTWGEKEYVKVLLASLVVNYLLARAIGREQARGKIGKAVVGSAVVFNLGLLGYFKYAGFVCRNLSPLWEELGGRAFSAGDVHLPIGISFFSFQAMSYVIDVYRRDVPADRNFLRFGLYVFLFPHLIAGPIVRYRDIAGQLKHRPASLDQFAEGVRRLVAGLGKKLLIADTLAVTADAAFQVPPGELSLAAASARTRLLQSANLLRFLGLLGYGHRSRQTLRVRFPRKLPASLLGIKRHRFLAPLAHQPFLLVPRLRLYPARREPGRAVRHLPELDDRIPPLRPLARGELDLPRLARGTVSF